MARKEILPPIIGTIAFFMFLVFVGVGSVQSEKFRLEAYKTCLSSQEKTSIDLRCGEKK